MTTFDTLAPTYDSDFTHSPIARHLRARVHARLDQLCTAGDAVLELGCGTGEDALYLARRGVQVLATDASEAMLAVAQAKLADYANAQVERLDLREVGKGYIVETDGKNAVPTNTDLDSIASDEACLVPTKLQGRYSLAFANFGVLNCLDDWRPLARWLAEVIAPGGHAAFAIMPSACLWEMAWHGLHGEWSVAIRRWRRGGAAFGVIDAKGALEQADAKNGVPTDDSRMADEACLVPIVAIHYPSVRKLTRDFAPWFRRAHVEPLGLLLPPSDIYGVIEKRPPLLRTLLRLDDVTSRLPMLANLCDHYWIEFRRL
jgi:SAM-dependent methyltransferase